MPRTAFREAWLRARSRAQALARGAVARGVGVLLAFTLCASPGAAAEPVAGEATVSKPGNYARLVIKLQSEVEAEARIAGTILIIQFKKPVDVVLDKLAETSPDYIGSARVDPDGMAIRVALSRKATPNMMAAGERLFVDLLPENWTGPPPGLPADVVKELADRARAAEQALRLQKFAAETQKLPPIRVKASRQPTFVRYVFDLSAGYNVSSILSSGTLTLNFTPTATFDLADAQLMASPNVVAVRQKTRTDGTSVTFELVGEVDIHSFREEKTYIVDVGFEPDSKSRALLMDPKAVADKPSNKSAEPAKPSPAAASSAAVKAAPAAERSEPPAAPAEATPHAASEPAPATQAVSEAKPPAGDIKPPVAEAAVTDAKPVAAEQPVIAETKVPPADAASPPSGDSKAAIAVQAKRGSGALRLLVPFDRPTSGAVFSRDDSTWLVFGDETAFNVSQVAKESAGLVREASAINVAGGAAIRLRLSRPQLSSVSFDGTTWIVDLADASLTPPQPLNAMRSIAEAGRGSVSVPIAAPGKALKLTDPDVGDVFMIVTAAPPAQGFIRRQNFVDFSLLASAHGIVVLQGSDDLQVETGADKVTLSRPGGLTLSAAEATAERKATAPVTVFDPDAWKASREANFGARRDELMTAAAMSSGDQRMRTHVDLARFYLAYGLYPEAKGALDLVLTEAKPNADDAVALVLRAIANILRGDPERGLAELANPLIGGKYDAQLWRGVAYARLGKWADAREKFKGADVAIGGLPLELQRIVMADELRAASEVRDYASVSNLLNDLETLGVPAEMQPRLALIRGRMDEALGRDKDAIGAYQRAVMSNDRIAGAAARVDEITLRQKRNEISNQDALAALETLAVTWRGDGTEIKTLQSLARLYAGVGRYREALLSARTATRLQANSLISRQLQDDAAALFTDIFLGPKGDELPPVQALALFYEFSELTPIGRRGDELIRRLADRLVAIDLLDQASELLQYQIDNRLDGAARAQVASRVAMVYLMNRKPDRAIGVLRASRVSDLAGDLRTQRLLIEARAQSDIGRPDLALDVISNLSGREVLRLRSDIHWAARRWRESSEQIELMYGNRWQDFQPLTAEEKSDIMRAAIGYSLAEDEIGTARLREKYAAKMENEDKAAFDAATRPASANSATFGVIAKMAATVDTLSGFVRDMKARFPEVTAKAPLPEGRANADPLSTGSLPKIEGLRPVSNVKLN